MKTFKEFLSERSSAPLQKKLVDKKMSEEFVIACLRNNKEKVQEFLDKNLDVNVPNSWNKYPLNACMENSEAYDILVLLLQHGADISKAEYKSLSMITEQGFNLLLKYGLNEKVIYEAWLIFVLNI